MSFFPSVFVSLLAGAATAGGDAPLGSVTDGDCRYDFVNFGDLFEPPTPLVAGFSNYKAWPSDGSSGDNLRQQWFYYRLDATSAEQAFPHPDTATYASDPGLIELAWEPAPGRPFAARLQCELRDTGAGRAVFVQRLTLTNPSASPLAVELFHYAAITVSEAFGGNPDTAALVGQDRIRIDDQGTFGFDEYAALDADGWKVQGFNNLLQFDLLNGSPSTFDDTGLPFGPGFFTGGFQWHLALPAGESRSVRTSIAVNDSASLELHEFNWTDLGLGKPGSFGTPALDGSGPLAAGTTNRLTLTAANPSSPALLVAGLERIDMPFQGGVLIPSLHVVLPLTIDATGALDLPFVMPGGFLSSDRLYAQVWILDPGANGGVAASNGIEGAAP